MNVDLLEVLNTQTEQRLILPGVSWQQYLTLDSAFEEFPGLRLTYSKGILEIITVSPRHELEKKMIARLVEMYAFAKNIDIHGYGSTPWRSEAAERGVEADECYCVGQLKDFPDFAIEVVITSGGIDKLEVYQGLGVSEVWFWQNQQFFLYYLHNQAYESTSRSKFLLDLDLSLLARYVQPQNQPTAVREFYPAICH